MVKLIFLFTIIISCSTSKITNTNLTHEMKSHLFKMQNLASSYKGKKDQFLDSVVFDRCFDNWSKEVEQLNRLLLVDDLKDSSKKLDAWYRLGTYHSYVGESNKVIYYYDLLLSEKISNDRKSNIYYNFGELYERNELFVMAKASYEESLKFNSDNARSEFKLALLEMQVGLYEKSSKRLIRIVKKYPKSNLVKFYLGMSYYYSGSLDQLKNKVLRLLDEKSDESVLLNLAISLEKNSDKKTMSDLENFQPSFFVYRDFKEFILAKYK